MEDISNYKRRIIEHYYNDTGSIGGTRKKYNISYKLLYKIINNSRIISFKIIDGVRYKKCCSCKTLLPYDDTNFYRRKGTKYYYSSCKTCMGLLSKAYKIINKDKLSIRNKENAGSYYNNNKTTIRKQKKEYYIINRSTILNNKKISYIISKIKTIRNFLRKL